MCHEAVIVYHKQTKHQETGVTELQPPPPPCGACPPPTAGGRAVPQLSGVGQSHRMAPALAVETLKQNNSPVGVGMTAQTGGTGCHSPTPGYRVICRNPQRGTTDRS